MKCWRSRLHCGRSPADSVSKLTGSSASFPGCDRMGRSSRCRCSVGISYTLGFSASYISAPATRRAQVDPKGRQMDLATKVPQQGHGAEPGIGNFMQDLLSRQGTMSLPDPPTELCKLLLLDCKGRGASFARLPFASGGVEGGGSTC